MIGIYYTQWDGKNGSHELLRRAAADWCDRVEKLCPEVPESGRAQTPQEFLIQNENSNEKPRFADPSLPEFSISHTGALWMCAVSKQPVGLDVQEARSLDREKISRRFFHPAEDAWLKKNAYRDFFQVWAAKESFLKYTGEGMRREMNTFCVVGTDGFLPEINGIRQFRYEFHRTEGSLALCLSTRMAVESQEIAFFSLEFEGTVSPETGCFM